MRRDTDSKYYGQDTQHEQASDEEYESECSMMSLPGSEVPDWNGICDEFCYIDSCASLEVFIVKSEQVLDEFIPDEQTINLTDQSTAMTVTGTGSKNDWNDIRVCPNSRKNICALNLLVQRGYKFAGGQHGMDILDNTGQIVISAKWVNGMPQCSLREIFGLKRIGDVEVNLSDGTESVDDLSVWHRKKIILVTL